MKPIPLRADADAMRRASVTAITKAVLAEARAQFEGDRSGARVARMLWPDDRATLALVERTASAPATTTTAGWAAELAQTAVVDLLVSLGPAGVTAAAGNASFVGQGSPIPVRQLAVSAGVALQPSKLATIFGLTRELIESSNAEQLVRMVMIDSLAAALDAALFGSTAGDATRPPGLLAGISGITPATGGSSVAMLQDIGKLVEAVSPTSGLNIAFVADPGTATKMMLTAGPKFSVPVFATNGVGANTIIAIGLSALVSAVEATPRVEVSRDVAIVTDNVPSDIFPSTGATKSMYQTDSLAVKFVTEVAWGLRAAGACAWISGLTW